MAHFASVPHVPLVVNQRFRPNLLPPKRDGGDGSQCHLDKIQGRDQKQKTVLVSIFLKKILEKELTNRAKCAAAFATN